MAGIGVGWVSGGCSPIATIVQVKGSIPSFESAKLLVREDGSMLGTMGAGCVEAGVWSRTEERRGGKEGRSRWAPSPLTKGNSYITTAKTLMHRQAGVQL